MIAAIHSGDDQGDKMIRTFRRVSLFSIALAAPVAASAAPAGAGILYDQLSPPGGFTVMRSHDTTPDNANDGLTADDFTVPNSEGWLIERVLVRVSGVPTKPVSVRIYSNSAGNLPGTVECVRTGNTITSSGSGSDIVLNVRLSSGCSVPQGTHWVSIYTDSTSALGGGLLSWYAHNDGTVLGGGSTFMNFFSGSCVGGWSRATTCSDTSGKISDYPNAVNNDFQLQGILAPTVLHDQLSPGGDFTVMRSHNTTPDNTNDGLTADDFVVPAGQTWSVTRVLARVTDVPTKPISVDFYSNSASDLPSTLECHRAGNEISTSGSSLDVVLTVTLSSGCSLAAGIHWVNVYSDSNVATAPILTWWAHNDHTTVLGNAGSAFRNFFVGDCQGAWFRATTCADTNGKIGDPANAVNNDFQVLGNAASPTAVAIRSATAIRRARGVVLQWRSGIETALLGFNVYRQQSRTLTKLNATLIPGVFGGTTNGHGYSWSDRRAPRGTTAYRLQAVGLNGKRTWAAAAVAT
jgi:hypothetical protein